MNRLRALWWRVRSGLWFIPSLMVLGAMAGATVLVELDPRVNADLAQRWPRLFGAGAEGAREMLSAIASSMITVAGVVFSVTLVALSLAASQYSPRVLRTFMSDRPTQAVLGVFVGVFAYCLVVLRTVRGGEEGGFVPSLAVLGAIVLALVAIAFLVYFIHHLATAIGVTSILSRIGDATLKAVQDLFPEDVGKDPPHPLAVEQAARAIGDWARVAASASGYIVSVDSDGLVAFARDAGRVLRMEHSVGEFVIAGQTLAALAGSKAPSEDDAKAVNRLFAFAEERTIEQDAAFGIQQIVDVAVKALSPGINDPTTAILCIDRLAQILARLARRRVETPYRFEGEALRVVAIGPRFDDLIALAVEEIRDNARDQVPVLLRLLWALERVEEELSDPGRVGNVREHARRIRQALTK